LGRRWNSTSEKAIPKPPPPPPPPPQEESIPIREPSYKTLRLVAITQAIPFVGFGFMDNAILIIAGDAIDTSLGVLLGISTLCAAAIGNIISDLAGICMGTAIEDFCAQVLKLPIPKISSAQRRLRSVRFASQLGMAVGMTFGCLIGMFPLYFLDTKKSETLKKKAHLESLFRDVVTEAKTLIGAESTCLYIRVEPHNKGEEAEGSSSGGSGGSSSSSITNKKQKHPLPYRPTADGEYLYAMYYVLPNKVPTTTTSTTTTLSSSTTAQEDSARFLPLGRGIVGRAMLTGEAWNIPNVHEEPDFYPDVYEPDGSIPQHLKHMVVVPVLDGQGRAIAVIRAMNKQQEQEQQGQGGTIHSHGSGFTDQDVQILKTLASHISVSLQSVYQQDEDDEEMRLRDTIRILKEHGIQGIASSERNQTSKTKRPLFPE
jgi:GAF domain-containing protein